MANDSGLVAIYPGSFDPLTNGHLDLIRRGSKLVNRLIVAVLNNTSKQPLFSAQERRLMLTEETGDLPNVEVDCFDGLLVDYASLRGAKAIVRGARSVADYEAERQMASFNRQLKPGLETVLLMSREEFSFISSQMIKEVIKLGGDVKALVPAAVAKRLGSLTIK